MNSFVLCCALHVIYLFLFWVSIASACRLNYELLPWQDGRPFFLSDNAPVTKALNAVPGAADNAELLLDHIRNVENAVYFARRTERAKFDTSNRETLETCNYREFMFQNSAHIKFGAWGWPFANTTCVTDQISDIGTQHLNMTRTNGFKYTIGDIFIALSNYTNMLRGDAKKLATAADLSNSKGVYPKLTPELRFPFGEKCILEATAAVRFDDVWYLRAIFTIDRTDHLTGKEARQIIREFPTIINGRFSSPKKMCMRLNNDTHERKQGTTELRYAKLFRPGENNLAMFGKLEPDRNPSILTSLDRLDKFIQQTNDALTPSNIAILVLPLFLNLVPVALISDVTTSFMLFYTVLTDILTVIPLGIKGVELISIGYSAHRSVAVRISSSLVLPRSTAAAAELWASECYVSSNVRIWGVFFLVLSVVFMIVGIVVEFVAQAYMKRKRGHLKNEFQKTLPLVFKKSVNCSDGQSGNRAGEEKTSLLGTASRKDNLPSKTALKSNETHSDDVQKTELVEKQAIFIQG